MPMMTGLTLAREIHRIDDNVPILLCSGYSDAVTVDEAKRAGIRRFLAKPLEMNKLAATIKEALSTGQERDEDFDNR